MNVAYLMATGTAQNAQKNKQPPHKNNKNTGGEDKCRCFFLCTDTETGVAVGIISKDLEYWNNQTTLLLHSTYH